MGSPEGKARARFRITASRPAERCTSPQASLACGRGRSLSALRDQRQLDSSTTGSDRLRRVIHSTIPPTAPLPLAAVSTLSRRRHPSMASCRSASSLMSLRHRMCRIWAAGNYQCHSRPTVVCEYLSVIRTQNDEGTETAELPTRT